MGKREYPDISFQSREKRHKVRKKKEGRAVVKWVKGSGIF